MKKMERKNKVIEGQMELAGIQYSGLAGITAECLQAIVRMLHFGDKLSHAKLLSCTDGYGAKSHAFLLTINCEEIVAIKSGFGSGYNGEGCFGLSQALRILKHHDVEIDEYDVDDNFIGRLDASALTIGDLEQLKTARPVRPAIFYDYMTAYDGKKIGLKNSYDSDLRDNFPTTIPLNIIDERIIDLALSFSKDSDNAILGAYRRLEDIVKDRTGIKDKTGVKLFSTVFLGDEACLHWEDEDQGVHVGKAKLFEAVFGAYRNPRAHGECKADEGQKMREFILVNELFLLEKAAVEKEKKVQSRS